MRKILYPLAFLFVTYLMFSCQSDDSPQNTGGNEISSRELVLSRLTPRQVYNKNKLDQLLNYSLSEGSVFDWNTIDGQLLCDAVEVAGGGLAISYADDNFNFSLETRDEILKNIYRLEGIEKEDLLKIDEVLTLVDDELGFVFVNIKNCSTIEWVKSFEGTTYVEVLNFPFDKTIEIAENLENADRSSYSNESTGSTILSSQRASREETEGEVNLDRPKGVLPCAENSFGTRSNEYYYCVDYVEDASVDGEGRKQYYKNCLADCFTHEYNELSKVYEKGVWGKGITIGVIDTGTSPEQEAEFLDRNLGTFTTSGHYRPFAKPYWFPNKVDILGSVIGEHDGIYFGKWYDFINPNHGLRMINNALTKAPKANVQSYRGFSMVFWVLPSHYIGAAKAIKAAADNPATDIISMSAGFIFKSFSVVQAIKYAKNKGKLVFVAGGTSIALINDYLSVTFPGSMEETIACTSVKIGDEREDALDESQFGIGEAAHKGPEIEFTLKSDNSSEATSSMAGIAALVWSVNPKLTAGQVKNILVESSSSFESKREKMKDFGWGFVNVNRAVEIAKETTGIGPSRFD